MDKPFYTVQTLRGLLKKSESTVIRLENSLKQAPEGRIQTKEVKGIKRFYRIRADGTAEYLGKNKVNEIKALIQKKLDLELLKVTQREKKVLEEALKSIGVETREQVWARFPEVLKGYVKVDESVNVGYIKSWQELWGIIDKDDEHKFKTARGDYVRSKSEYIIADILFRNGIPYHYEMPLVLEHGLFVYKPDFSVLNTRTLKQYYWEHFGMIDKKAYFNSMKEKLDVYAEYGIFPGKNLIMTFESAEKPLSVEHVERQLKEYLL